MSFVTFLRAVKKHLVAIVLTPMFAVALAAAFCYACLSDTYSAQATLYILMSDSYTASTSSSNYSSLSLNFSISQQIANDVSDLLMSNRARTLAAESLGVESLSGYSISASCDEESRILTISVEGRSPEGVADSANALADVASELAQEIMNVQSINVIDWAETPVEPNGPNRVAYVSLAGAVGLVAALSVTALGAWLDVRIREAATAQRVSGLSVLGRIPRLAKRGHGGDGTIVRAAQEAAKTLAANIVFMGADRTMQTIAVTSPSDQEGKTTVTCLVAQALAATGNNVLVVDCDLRDGRLSELVDSRSRYGLVDVLYGRALFTDAVEQMRQSGLYYLAGGTDVLNPTEIVSSGRFSRLLEMLKGKFDYVVLDTSPLDAYADAAVIASKVDAVLMVVREGETRRDALREATEQLRKAGVELAGIAMNDSVEQTASHHTGARRKRGRDEGYALIRAALGKDVERIGR